MKAYILFLSMCFWAWGCGGANKFEIDLSKLLSAEKRPQITAHRGDSNSAPENTMPAITMAIKAQADFVEIDVRETKDGVIVLLHDANLERVSGLDRDIRDMDWAEVKAVDVGRTYSPKYQGVTIPRLEDVLKAASGRIKVNVEIKTDRRGYGLVDTVVGLIEKYGLSDQCVITSRDYGALCRVKSVNPRLATGLIFYIATPLVLSDQYVDFYSIRQGLLTPETVDSAHNHGKKVQAWTVNKARDMAQCIALGVDNIVTDHPSSLARLLGPAREDRQASREVYVK